MSLPPRRHRPSFLGPVLLILGVGCGSPTTPGPPPPTPPLNPKITVVARPAEGDSIDAPIGMPLVVEVELAGRPAARVPIYFSLPNEEGRPPIILLNGESYTAVTQTGADGRAQVGLRRGPRLGRVQLVVRAIDYGLVATVDFETGPGAPAGLVLPGAIGVTVGDSARVPVAVVDRLGNPRPDQPAFELEDGLASITPSGMVQGIGLGTDRLTVIVGQVRDTVAVRVVPAGEVALIGDRFVVARLDGSRVRTVPVGPWAQADWIWWPDGSAFLFGGVRLYRVDLDGNANALIPATGPGSVGVEGPSFSADGWIVFAAGNALGGRGVFRVRADGTNLESLIEGDIQSGYGRPSVSPDGKSVLVVGSDFPDEIVRLDVATKVITRTGLMGSFPQWSPDGTQFAFRGADRSLRVAAPDGSGDHQVLPPDLFGTNDPVTWSPDGTWLLARDVVAGVNRPLLVAAATGSVIPLDHVAGFYRATWRPGLAAGARP